MSTQLSALNVIRHPGEPTTESYLERPSPWGSLRLDVLDFDNVPDSAHTPAEIEEADRALREGQMAFRTDQPQRTVDAMIAITRRWPLWVGGHGGTFTVLTFVERHAEAIFHLRQSIAVLPDRSLVRKLQRALRTLGQMKESVVVGELLWSERAMLSTNLARGVALDLLIALGELKRFGSAADLAGEVIGALGPFEELILQRVYNLSRAGRWAEAEAAWIEGSPHVPAGSEARKALDDLGRILRDLVRS